MQYELILPALGMNQDNGVIATWHKKEGDQVAIGDIIMDIETDKAVMEIEAEHDGFLSEIRYQAGVEVPIGSIVGYISTDQNAKKSNIVDVKEHQKEPPTQMTKTQEKIVNEPKDQNMLKPTIEEKINRSTEKKSQALASPKARSLLKKYNILLDSVVGFCKKNIIHAADVETYYDCELAKFTTKDKVSASKETLSLAFDLDAKAFYSCALWLENKDTILRDGSHLLTVLVSASLREASVVDNDHKLTFKVDHWVGSSRITTMLSNPDKISFSNLKPESFDERNTANHDYHIIYFSNAQFREIKIANVSKPTCVAYLSDGKLRCELVGFYYAQLDQFMQFSQCLKEAFKAPLMYLT